MKISDLLLMIKEEISIIKENLTADDEKRIKELQKTDSKILEYMNYIVMQQTIEMFLKEEKRDNDEKTNQISTNKKYK